MFTFEFSISLHHILWEEMLGIVVSYSDTVVSHSHSPLLIPFNPSINPIVIVLLEWYRGCVMTHRPSLTSRVVQLRPLSQRPVLSDLRCLSTEQDEFPALGKWLARLWLNHAGLGYTVLHPRLYHGYHHYWTCFHGFKMFHSWWWLTMVRRIIIQSMWWTMTRVMANVQTWL